MMRLTKVVLFILPLLLSCGDQQELIETDYIINGKRVSLGMSEDELMRLSDDIEKPDYTNDGSYSLVLNEYLGNKCDNLPYSSLYFYFKNGHLFKIWENFVINKVELDTVNECFKKNRKMEILKSSVSSTKNIKSVVKTNEKGMGLDSTRFRISIETTPVPR